MNINKLSKDFTVKKLKIDDVENIYNLCIRNTTFYRYCPPTPSKDSIIEDMKILPPNTQPTDKYYLGFFDNSNLIAVIDLILNYPNHECAFIGFFMLELDLQGKGLGSKIISDIIKYLSSLGYKYTKLGYADGNIQSKSFWTKNNFKETGERKTTKDYTIISMLRENKIDKV